MHGCTRVPLRADVRARPCVCVCTRCALCLCSVSGFIAGAFLGGLLRGAQQRGADRDRGRVFDPTAYDGAHLSRIENALRPPTRALAQACDEAFPERHGWFLDYYEESRQWAEVPPGFRDWSEITETRPIAR